MSLPRRTHAGPAVLHNAPPQLFTSLDNLFMVWPQGLPTARKGWTRQHMNLETGSKCKSVKGI